MPHWSVGARLLSCASVLALSGAFAGGASAHPPHCKTLTGPTTITHDKTCVRVKTTIDGDVVNDATIGKAHDDRPGFFIGDGGLITGELVNDGVIFGGGEGTGALTLGEGADVEGGIVNNGAIVSWHGSGISIGVEREDDHHGLGHVISHGHHYGHDHGGNEAAALTGDIVNNGLIFGKDYGVVARRGTMSGALVNQADGVIIGGDIGVYVPDSFTEWSGGIRNAGLILGGESAIRIGGGEGDGVAFSGGIANETGGTLLSITGPTLFIGGESFAGGVYNDGLITQLSDHDGYFHGKHASPYAGVGVVFTAPTIAGGLVNGANGEIYGTKGPAIWITDETESFAGGIANLGTIAGASDAIRIESASFAGGLTNAGAIVASEGDAVFASSAWTGGVVNHGLIAGADNGFAYVGSTFTGDFANTGTIEGGAAAVLMTGDAFDGAFTNTGLIAGATGVALDFTTASGPFSNSGSITGDSGNGVAISVGTWGAEGAPADIVNAATGVITGGDTGFLLDVGAMYGDFVNDGTITGNGENTGVHIIADDFFGDVTNNNEIASPYDALVLDIGLFGGSFTNTGNIAGGEDGAVMLLGEMTGNFTNSGSIAGDTGNGVDITIETWGSEEAPVAINNAATGVISGGATGFALDAGALHGAFTNDGLIEGGTTGASFTADTFDAPFANSGDITGGVDGVVMVLGQASGSFTNSGSIAGDTGNGVDIVVTTWGSEQARADILNTIDGTISGGANGLVVDLVTLHGDVTNDGLVEGGELALLMTGGAFDGAFTNTGTIDGGTTGVAMTLENVTGPFSNSGAITGDSGDGVAITAGTWGAEGAPAHIVNTATGVITGGDTGFLLDVGTMYGDFINDGTITGAGENTGVHITADDFFGNVANSNEIASPYDALVLDIGLFDGSFTNTGNIAGGEDGAVMLLGEMTGDFTNSGSIAGDTGNGVDISVETWGSEEAPVAITNAATGIISGGATGFALDAATLHGAFTNDGLIEGGTTGASFTVDTFDAPFANSGDITGGVNGVVMVLGEASGGFTNSGAITGDTGNGVDIVVTAWGTEESRADILNTVDGTISGGANGLVLDLVTLHGDIKNDGLIEGGDLAVLMTGSAFDGAFTNTGTIDGGTTGVALTLETVTGPFSNSGAITGDTGDGVAITAGTWGSEAAPADIVNTATGVITGGDTGFLLDVGTMYGDFINDGAISGNDVDTGLHIVAGTFLGDVVNNGTLDAPSNALHLEIGTLDGEVLNTGTIAATAAGGIAAAFDIGNGATFTNTGGGLILGDVVFGGNAAYAFIAGDGGTEGDLIGQGGEGNDDTITVTGEHTFLGAGGGAGAASNFASFTVADGAVAFMGAAFEGDPNGTGYAFANVDALNVEQGGMLYVDKATTLNVGSFTQEAGGTVEFYLGAPGGEGFSDLTGTVVAGADDYGQIIVDGPVALDGNVVGFLDPAFADANPGLDQVQYNDVIVGDSISGDFSTVALIADSSLFELTDVIDDNTVDMLVTRTSLVDVGSLSGVIVNLGGPFDSMVNDRSNGIGSGSCGLASAADGWCFNRFAANEAGATQVITDAPSPDPFAWLRTGVRQVGETAVWGRAIGVFGDTDGDAGNSGSEFDVVGAIVGVDHVFTPILLAGVAAQWTTTDIDFKGRPDNAEVESFEAGVYVSYGDTRLYLNANASVIWHDIDVNRFTPAGSAFGDYDGTTLSAFAEVGKTFETQEGFRIQPFVAMSYSHLETDAYRETGTGTRLNVSDSEFDSLKSTVGLRLAYPIPLDSGRKVVPEARIAWGHEFMDDQASFLATIQGGPPVPTVVKGEKFSRDTAIVGAGVTVPLSDSSSVFVDYDAGLNTDITTHTVSAGIRIRW